MKDIIIVGTGWYGLHIFLYLKNNYKNINIIILEKNKELFNNSSNYNQNRLHLGYHYPRSGKTRNLCKFSYDKFIKKYRDIIDFIDNNFYIISSESLIDYETFIKIYSEDNKYDHTIICNKFFNNIDGNIINTKEKIINSIKAKKYFEENIENKYIKFNYEVKSIKQMMNNKILINNELECDFVIDCSYNQLQLSKYKYIYEFTISLIYEKKNKEIDFDSLTIMDGEFFSLFPRDINKQKYTLTHVKYTPIIKSIDINKVLNYKLENEEVIKIKNYMENDVKKYYKNFKKDFEYIDFFTSYKCKLLCSNDTRECNIECDNNIISVNCGKITGIFEFEKYIKKYFEEILI